ncbi:hypothetical protein PDESU_04985 [Pontiella desulfatans]|uniref:Uncharacterized protein n=2 Tax=Pontiella desulfatans TaxID=2750659 RepID=A0A6C2UAI9_PONDE|nr:hypothetical protein PDESU_04985 [Pontiella desulfatans]
MAFWDWMTLDYEDSDWEKATVLKRTVGWPSPQKNERPGHLVPPWTTLVERDIPYLMEGHIAAGSPVTPGVNVEGAGQCRVEIYDVGQVLYGRPSLEIEAPEGTVVDIMSVPYLLSGEIRKTIAASRYTDRLICSGERDQWTAFYEKPVRWLAVVFRTAAEDAVLHDVSISRSAYPFVEQGSVNIPSAPELEMIWHASAETIRVCTSDAYTDNYRERRQYAQTAYYACLGNYPVFGDTALQRRYLIQIAQEQLANGMMPAYAPRHGGDFMVILDSNCFWIRGLHQYLIHSGDEETVRALLPAARKLMELFAGYSNQDGLIDSPPYPYWLDHVVQDRRGANFCLNGHYLGAVEDFAAVLQFFGEDDAGAFAALGQRMRAGLTEFYVEDRSLFCDAMIDGVHSDLFSEHANAMALAMGIASPEQQKAIAEKLLAAGTGDFVKHDDGTIMVTPAMSYFLHKGLCEAGFIDESFALLEERFNPMLEEEHNGTLWEEWWLDATGRSGKRRPFPAGRSDAQTESAFPPALMTEYLLGIKAVSPGMQRVKLNYYASERILHRKGSVPTPRGLITVEWKADASSIQLNLTVPEETEVALDRAGLGRSDSRHMLVNGERTPFEGPYLKLSPGTYRVVVER